MNQLLSRITVDPAICHGKPCIRGLRYPIRNRDLETLTAPLIPNLLAEFKTHSFLELSNAGIVIRG
jgi:hypothetical protein